MNQTGGSSFRRKIIVLRHGERMDFTFGHSWIQEQYVRTDVNMPESIPARDFNHWRHDTPLTALGEQLAESVGSSMKASGVKLSHVFVSPAFRCLQTARGVLRGMGMEDELPMNVESGLYEWTGFLRQKWPDLLTAEDAGKIFNINVSYGPVVDRSELENAAKESVDEYYERSFRVTREILKQSEGDVLIVAHGASLETCTRQLIGKEKRSTKFLLGELIHLIPYLGAIAVEQNGDIFRLIEPPCLTVTHDSSKKENIPKFGENPHNKTEKRFDWRIFLDT